MNTSSFWFQGAGGVDPDDPGFPIHQSLRFSELTGYPLQGPQDNTDGFGANWTISFWFKWSGNNVRNTLMWTSSPAGNYTSLNISQTNFGDLNFSNRSSDYFTNGIRLRDTSAWYHFVFNPNQIWINGKPQNPPANYWGNMEVNQYIATGWDSNSIISGYYADWYLVQQTLTADTFGRFNANGVWVPKDPEFGSAAVYSTYLTSVGGLTAYPAINAFNGDITDYASPADSVSPMVWAPPDVSFNSKFEVYIPGFTQATWNGITVGNTGSVGWVEVATGSGTINATNPLTISRVSSYPALYAIKIDGKILIDQNIWSNYLSSSSGSVTNPENAFQSTIPGGAATSPAGSTMTWAPEPKVSFTNGLAVWTQDDAVNGTLEWNGISVPKGGNSAGWTQITSGAGEVSVDKPLKIISSGATLNYVNGIQINGTTTVVDGQSPVWGAKGFHLTFADPNDIGKDYSGNGNDFTATGFDTVPPGVATTIYTESPKNYGSAIDTSTSLGSIPITPATLSSSNTQLFELSVPVKSVTIASLAGVPSGCTVEISADGAANNWTTKINGGSWTDEASGGQVITDANDFKYVRVGFTSNMNWGLISQPSGSVGSDYDLMKDSPTQNYATLSPLLSGLIKSTVWKYNYANLGLLGNGQAGGKPTPFTSGKFYWETIATVCNNTAYLGVGVTNSQLINDVFIPSVTYSDILYKGSNGEIQIQGVATGESGDPWGVNDVIGCAVDTEALTCSWYKNGVLQVENFDISWAQDLDVNGVIVPGVSNDGFPNQDQTFVNFGQQPFKYTPPEGYKGLQTENMPTPAIPDGRTEFRAITGPGDGPIAYLEGSYATTVDAPVDTEGMASFTSFPTSINAIYPTKSVLFDFGSVDSCTITFQNSLFYDQTNPYTIVISADGVNWTQFGASPYENPPGAVSNDPGTYILEIPTQGSNFRYVRVWNPVQTNKNLSVQSISEALSILGAAQATFPSGLWWVKDMVNDNQHQLVTNAFTDQNPVWVMPQSNPGWADYVPPTGDSVAWCWSAPDDFSADGSGGAQGDIPCTGKINKKAGFSMIKFTNPTQAAKTIAHGLDKTPEFYVMAKDRGTTASTNASSKYTWHKDLTAGNYIYLDQAGAQTTNNFAGVINAVPTSSVFSIGNAFTANNGEFLALLWTSIPGYSAFGKYTGNANPDGSFIYTGFKPAFILVKAITSAYPWQIYDATRSPYNPAIEVLQPNLQTKEISSDNYALDILSNGFKWRAAYTYGNDSTDYIYAAFALNPFQSPVTAR